MSGPILGHLARRGVQAAQDHFKQASPAYVAKLQQDAALYEQQGPAGEINPMELLPIVITAIIALALIASIRYSVGEVMSSLAMIESPSSTAIIEPKASPYADDAPPAYADAEKESFIPSEAEPDVEVTVIAHKPITSKVVTTMGHLQRIGGFRARWRGLGLSILYHGLHGTISNLLAGFMGFGLGGRFISYVLVSLGLARIHMVWTHSMIAYPSAKPFWRRIVPRKQCKAILLPSLVFAVAQQATIGLPLMVAFAMGLPEIKREHVMATAQHENCGQMALLALRFFAVPATAIFVVLAVLLPASMTLTRIEAALLPEDEQTIVPFDKEAIVGELDLTVRGSSKALFVQAWRSIDRSARLRVVKMYVKMVLAQFTIVVIGLHLAMAEFYVIGGERLAVLIKSGAAQVKLMAIEVHQQAQADAMNN
ncbi:hypothetical protein LTR91_001455 [Friedmanniomyces endolithicus]|uniref:Uncharacterized protein n=1 Tax=Friedmanniomyces endolithicus TaxID=329885 RepID=A0A4V5N6M8_9PEZI|nr:hypothetical protein LTS09_008113 [Friedmanniomyces endolithicus]KAK0282469.1 hypothetical protein LTR35_006937 [Friedmanniomyces endolithicus]KAK0296102.1 hypothetical protein LTS00_005388 [Friedmanniomyces endolithicus]KAK0316718.1 hypothetical protein LTR01_000468 [Friedmanniomyces endolithicus]KAK0327924.1 hypothetical protein LTR82_001442 [Friedmanniomyces endolithicus]